MTAEGVLWPGRTVALGSPVGLGDAEGAGDMNVGVDLGIVARGLTRRSSLRLGLADGCAVSDNGDAVGATEAVGF